MRIARLLLLLVASAIVVLMAIILRRASERSPESVLSQARAMAAQEEPNFAGALLTIDQGLSSLKDRYSAPELGPLALERMRIYRSRWDRSLLDRSVASEPSDLRQVLNEAKAYIQSYQADISQALYLGTQAALEMGLHDEAEPLARKLLESSSEHLVRAQAHRSLGIVHVAYGDRQLRQLVASQGDLPQAESDEQLRHARRVAVLHSADPAKENLLDNFKSSLSPELAPLASQFVGDAARQYASAVQHYLEALELYPDEASVLGLQELLLRSESYNDVIDIGLLALDRQVLSPSTAILSQTLQALLATNRENEADELLKARLELSKEIPFDYRLLKDNKLNELCQMLLQLGNDRALIKAATELKDRNPERNASIDYTRLGYFYSLIARVRIKSTTNINFIIKKAQPEIDSYPGQLMEYWAALGALANLSENQPERLRFLFKAANEAPLDPSSLRMRKSTGEMWLSLAQTLIESGSLAAAEGPLAHALRLLPGQGAALAQSYAEAGEKALQSQGRSINQLRARPTLKDAEDLYPKMGPFEACYRARRCLELSQPAQVRPLLGPVLREFPGLPMPLLLLAEAELAEQQPSKAIEYLLEIEARGHSAPESRALMANMPAAQFNGAQLRQLLQFSPGESGFMALLQRCLSLGERERLLEIVTPQRVGEIPTAAVLLGIDVRLDRAQTAQALQLWERLDGDARSGAQAIGSGLRLVAALLGDPAQRARGQKLMRELLALRTWKSEKLERGVDALFADGHIDLAREALGRADSSGLPLVPDLLLRWAWSGALAGDAARDLEAIEALIRAEPYLRSGQADFARLLMDQDAKNDEAVAHWAERLLSSEFPKDAQQVALLSLLAGDRAAAKAYLARLDRQAGEAPLVLGGRASLGVKLIRAQFGQSQTEGDAAARDSDPDAVWYAGHPNLPIVLLLASEAAEFSAWVLAQQRSLTPEQQRTPLYAVARALAWRQLGYAQRADDELKPHTLSTSTQPEAWLLREQLAREALGAETLGLENEATRHLEALEQERLAILGPLRNSAAKVSWLRARAMNAAGQNQEATNFLGKVRKLWPLDPELLLALARMTLEQGQAEPALGLYVELLDGHAARAGAVLPEILQLLEKQASAGLLSRQALRARLDSLQAILPSEPALALALAKLQLAQVQGGSTWNSVRALDHLKRFRERTRQRSLESLVRGSAQSWFDFLAAQDSAKALKFAESELNAHPEKVELWRMWLGAMVDKGQLLRARSIYKSINAIFNDEHLEREYGMLLIDSGQSLPSELQRSLQRRAERDPELALRLLLSSLSGNTKDKASLQARQTALKYWAERRERQLEPAATARLLLRALGPEDEALRSILETALVECGRPLQACILRALIQLSAFPKEARPEQS